MYLPITLVPLPLNIPMFTQEFLCLRLLHLFDELGRLVPISDDLSYGETRRNTKQISHGQKSFDSQICFNVNNTNCHTDKGKNKSNPSHCIKTRGVVLLINVVAHKIMGFG